MTPFTAPPLWPDIRAGRFAETIVQSDSAHPDRDAEAFASGMRVALLGLADDTGVRMNHGRPGAQAGPAAFRAALAKYGSAAADPGAAEPRETTRPAPYSRSLPGIFDAGDIIPAGSLEETHDRVTAATGHLVSIGYFPIGIGGGHDLTFPFVRAVIDAHRRSMPPQAGGHASAPFCGFYLDAHLDVREEPGSGMPFRRLVEACGVSSLTCVGYDPFANAADHLRWFRAHAGRTLGVAEAERVFSMLANSPAPGFVSIDLDSLDAAFAPGVSAVNPCGLAPPLACRFARAAGETDSLKCFDIMELSPRFDPDGRTARLAARLLLEFLAGFATRAGSHPAGSSASHAG
ncbi:MAG: formimidoylglutamase [Phycisphaerales bacterium]